MASLSARVYVEEISFQIMLKVDTQSAFFKKEDWRALCLFKLAKLAGDNDSGFNIQKERVKVVPSVL